MNYRLIHQLPPTETNPRNSEGAFLRGKQGEIFFAYSRYHTDIAFAGKSHSDHAPCDIYMITSYDEGESWSEPRMIASAACFGVMNIMSVSALEQQNGDLAFYFLIKEKDCSTTLGRALSKDGVEWRAERCGANFPPAYYVVNNDRLVRMEDGRILAPAAYWSVEDVQNRTYASPMVTTLLISEDDGVSFYKSSLAFSISYRICNRGLMEPGIIQLGEQFYLWMRTQAGCQFESWSEKGLENFETPQPSIFTSPSSPMQMKWIGDAVYAVYNPVPCYNGREKETMPGVYGRTPLTLRKSTDGGKTFGPLQNIEEDPLRGYSYPAMFETRDGCILLGYCRGDFANDKNNLCRIGIGKVELNSIE